MGLPKLLKYQTEEEYRQHYIKNYCEACPIYTYDNIPVMFYEDKFDHSFYKRTHQSWEAKKDRFSYERGERMDWIKYVLQDPNIIPRKGYDKAKKSYDNTRRVTFLSDENYLVVIFINKKGEGKFVTAYVVDNEEASNKIRNSPRWEK
jgi:hypothetical protein